MYLSLINLKVYESLYGYENGCLFVKKYKDRNID